MAKKRGRGKKPDKPCPDFPLFAHAGGTWAKTIGGKHHHFGPWDDPNDALRRYKDHAAGRRPRPAADGSITMKEIGNRFLTYQTRRADAGQITLRSFRNFRAVVPAFSAHVGPGVAAADLHPDIFSAWWLKLAKRMGPAGVKKHVGIVRQMFRWAFNEALLPGPVQFGSGFTLAAKAKARPAAKLFSGEEVRRMMAAAGVNLRAMVLLGVNCGFGQTDIASLPADAVNLTAGVIDFARPKTGLPRRCPLWPETVAALWAANDARPRAADPADAGLFFLTRGGTRYVRETARREGEKVVGVTISDSVGPLFLRMMGRCGLWKLNRKGTAVSDGRNFYTLRRTFRTWADEAADQHAADVVMGHAFGTTGGGYVQHVDFARLKAVTDHVRSRVFT